MASEGSVVIRHPKQFAHFNRPQAQKSAARSFCCPPITSPIRMDRSVTVGVIVYGGTDVFVGRVASISLRHSDDQTCRFRRLCAGNLSYPHELIQGVGGLVLNKQLDHGSVDSIPPARVSGARPETT